MPEPSLEEFETQTAIPYSLEAIPYSKAIASSCKRPEYQLQDQTGAQEDLIFLPQHPLAGYGGGGGGMRGWSSEDSRGLVLKSSFKPGLKGR